MVLVLDIVTGVECMWRR